MDQTPRLGLPYIAPQQAQSHVTHNEAIRALDALVQISVSDRDRTAPPDTPAEGDQHIIAEAATGAWSGRDNQLAAFQDGAWACFPPQTGWRAWVRAEERLFVWDGTSWSDVVAGSVNPAQLVGVNAVADAVNRLAVKSDAVLFSHDDVTPGSGDMRAVLNKATTSGTASFLFQSQWAGRAEFGLTGNDDFTVKVLDDATVWHEALVADRATGRVTLPAGLLHAPSGQRPQGFIGMPGDNPIFRIDGLHAANPRTATIASISGDLITLSAANANTFFQNPHMAGKTMARIWNTSQSADQHSAWVIEQPAADQLQVLDRAALAGWGPGDTIQIGDPSSVTPNNVVALDISPMMEASFGQAFRQAGIFTKYRTSGDTSVLTALQTTTIGMTPTGQSGSFNNASSNNQGVAGQGILYMPCSELSPISNSNLVFVREATAAGGQTIDTSLIAILGMLVDL